MRQNQGPQKLSNSKLAVKDSENDYLLEIEQVMHARMQLSLLKREAADNKRVVIYISCLQQVHTDIEGKRKHANNNE